MSCRACASREAIIVGVTRDSRAGCVQTYRTGSTERHEGQALHCNCVETVEPCTACTGEVDDIDFVCQRKGRECSRSCSDRKVQQRRSNVRVLGRIICNNKFMMIEAARRGLGVAWLLHEPEVDELIASGQLVTVLDGWCDPFPGFYLYYPSRRQHSEAFKLVIDAVRWG
ncbi:hypothetical protein JY423_02190 [Stenotrophomonas maltophilia]|nr:hypothetical protein [Stenotrophomonas maltophilia]MBN4961069.1 hypothetical protein [Stenotrophomonas maltophilia]